MTHTITVCGDGRPDVLLKQGRVPREFPTLAAAQREARRLNEVAESKGVPWRYVPTAHLASPSGSAAAANAEGKADR